MDRDLSDIPKHILRLARAALMHANYHASLISFENAHWAELSVPQAAHAAELFIKARIAQEHPLLIFERVPDTLRVAPEGSLKEVIEKGRTFQFQDLPQRLHACTSMRIVNMERYRSFGELRNVVQHLMLPTQQDCAYQALRFVFEVIDPFINEAWGLYAVDHNEDYESYQYFVTSLVRQEIPFLVSAPCAQELSWFQFPESPYGELMAGRFTDALSHTS